MTSLHPLTSYMHHLAQAGDFTRTAIGNLDHPTGDPRTPIVDPWIPASAHARMALSNLDAAIRQGTRHNAGTESLNAARLAVQELSSGLGSGVAMHDRGFEPTREHWMLAQNWIGVAQRTVDLHAVTH